MCGIVLVILLPLAIKKVVQSLYFKILPLLGVNRHIIKEWQMMPVRYQGLGMPNFVVLSFLLKFFPQGFWGFEDTVNSMLLQAHEAFLVELGLGGNISTRDCNKLGCLEIDGTWSINFWEYTHLLRILVVIHTKYHLKNVGRTSCQLWRDLLWQTLTLPC